MKSIAIEVEVLYCSLEIPRLCPHMRAWGQGYLEISSKKNNIASYPGHSLRPGYEAKKSAIFKEITDDNNTSIIGNM